MTRTRRKTLAIVGTVTATTAILGGVRLAGPALAEDGSRLASHQRPGGVDSAGPSPTTPPETSPTPTASPSTSTSPSPSTSASPSTSPSTGPTCVATAGDPAEVVEPGIGTVTVTITVCNGTISSASSALSLSNYGRNTKALLAMDKLAVEYAVTDIDMVNYSGATCTSEAYRASLKSALTRAGLGA